MINVIFFVKSYSPIADGLRRCNGGLLLRDQRQPEPCPLVHFRGPNVPRNLLGLLRHRRHVPDQPQVSLSSYKISRGITGSVYVATSSTHVTSARAPSVQSSENFIFVFRRYGLWLVMPEQKITLLAGDYSVICCDAIRNGLYGSAIFLAFSWIYNNNS